MQAHVGEVRTRVAEHPGHRQKAVAVANRIAARVAIGIALVEKPQNLEALGIVIPKR